MYVIKESTEKRFIKLREKFDACLQARGYPFDFLIRCFHIGASPIVLKILYSPCIKKLHIWRFSRYKFKSLLQPPPYSLTPPLICWTHLGSEHFSRYKLKSHSNHTPTPSDHHLYVELPNLRKLVSLGSS